MMMIILVGKHANQAVNSSRRRQCVKSSPTRHLIGGNIHPHHHHPPEDSYDFDEFKDDEEEETRGDQSVLKYHISLLAEKIAAAAWVQKILLLFHSRFDFEQIDDKHPSDAHGRIWRSRL